MLSRIFVIALLGLSCLSFSDTFSAIPSDTNFQAAGAVAISYNGAQTLGQYIGADSKVGALVWSSAQTRKFRAVGYASYEVVGISNSGIGCGWVVQSDGLVLPAMWSTKDPTLLQLDPSVISGKATCISQSGTVIGGKSRFDSGSVATLWIDGSPTYPVMPSGYVESTITSVSPDGMSCGGFLVDALGQSVSATYSQTSATWSVPPGLTANQVTKVTAVADGNAAAYGYTSTPEGGIERYHTSFRLVNKGVQTLHGPDADHPYAIFKSCSSDGSFAVGVAFANNPSDGTAEAVIWDVQDGIQTLSNYLFYRGVPGVTTWNLATATGMSGDHTIICGTGTNKNGAQKPFKATTTKTVEPYLAKITVPPFLDWTQHGLITVQLNQPAGVNGADVVCTVDMSEFLKVQSTIHIEPGSTTWQGWIRSLSTVKSDKLATVSATLGAVSLTAPCQLRKKLRVVGISVSKPYVVNGELNEFTVSLDRAVLVDTSISISGYTYMSHVTMPAGSSSVTVPFTCYALQTKEIAFKASFINTSAATTFTIEGIKIALLTSHTDKVLVDSTPRVRVKMNSRVPPGGIHVVLSRSTNGIVFLDGESISIDPGETEGFKRLRAVAASSTPVTLTATFYDSSASFDMTVLPKN